MITPKKSVIGIDFVQTSWPFPRMMLGACFGPGPFSLDTAIETTHLQIILEVDVSQGGGGG